MPRQMTASEMGRKGGRARGDRKRRDPEHYRTMAAKSAEVRRVDIAVDPAGAWRLYSPVIPEGMSVIGTVTRDGVETGALCRVRATGLYVMLNAGVIRSLPQRSVREALAEIGA
jgi:hypothetical protein